MANGPPAFRAVLDSNVYDRDLLDLSVNYETHFRICPPLEFLAALRIAPAPDSANPSLPSE